MSLLLSLSLYFLTGSAGSGVPNMTVMNYLRPGLLSARDRQAAVIVTTAAETFFRYSKWHRLNQEVEKTTEKNKLDTIPYFCYFHSRLRF